MQIPGPENISHTRRRRIVEIFRIIAHPWSWQVEFFQYIELRNTQLGRNFRPTLFRPKLIVILRVAHMEDHIASNCTLHTATPALLGLLLPQRVALTHLALFQVEGVYLACFFHNAEP